MEQNTLPEAAWGTKQGLKKKKIRRWTAYKTAVLVQKQSSVAVLNENTESEQDWQQEWLDNMNVNAEQTCYANNIK